MYIHTYIQPGSRALLSICLAVSTLIATMASTDTIWWLYNYVVILSIYLVVSTLFATTVQSWV